MSGVVKKSSGFKKNGRKGFFGRYGSDERLRFKEEKEERKVGRRALIWWLS